MESFSIFKKEFLNLLTNKSNNSFNKINDDPYITDKITKSEKNLTKSFQLLYNLSIIPSKTFQYTRITFCKKESDMEVSLDKFCDVNDT